MAKYMMDTVTVIVDESDLVATESIITKAGLEMEVMNRQQLTESTERITYRLTGTKKAFLAWAGNDSSIADDITLVAE